MLQYTFGVAVNVLQGLARPAGAIEVPRMRGDERLALWQMNSIVAEAENVGARFEELLEASLDKEKTQVDVALIDIHRSLLNQNYWAELKDVLVAFSQRQALSGGYKQGMNLIAARFLEIGLSSRETFYALAWMVDEIALDYYTRDKEGMFKDIALIKKILNDCGIDFDPDLIDIAGTIIMPALGVNLVNHEAVRLWDLILLRRRVGWLAAATALLGFDCGNKRTSHLLDPVEMLQAMKTTPVDKVLERAVNLLPVVQSLLRT